MQDEGRSAKAALMRSFSGLRVLVVGDVLLDRYLVGSCERISPEAPVPVVRLQQRFSRLGGAANVAANLAALNVAVELAGVLGVDAAADEIITECAAAGIGTAALLKLASSSTIVKTRILASDRQIVRVDEEDPSPNADAESEALLQGIFSACEKSRPNSVVISDYAKGICTPYFCERLIAYFKEQEIPVFVDPKGRDYSKYRGATGIKPNRIEMTEVAKAKGWPTEDVVAAAQRLLSDLGLEFVALTLGAQGVAVVSPEGVHHIPTVAKEVYDVSGAGDTVIATMVSALAAGLDLKDSLALASLAAGVVVGHVGSRPIQRDELLLALQAHTRGERGRKRYDPEDLVAVIELWRSQGLCVGFTNGCFDLLHAGHVQLLEDSAMRVDKLIVAVNSDESVRRLKGPLRPLMAENQRVTVLSALEVVDAVVVFEEDTPLEIIKVLKPDVLIKGGDYTRETVVGYDVVEANGGRVELVPLVPGISTSYLATAIEKL